MDLSATGLGIRPDAEVACGSGEVLPKLLGR
jgi:hypothetical protein